MGLFSSIGKVVGGVVNGVTGLLGVKGQKDANSQANAFAREQLEYQKELHKNQIQWKVEDAKKAGLHPLAALGVSPSSFSPVSGASSGVNYSGFNGVGDMLSDLGQDIDRSILQAKTKEEQKDALRLQNQSIALDLQGKDLNNQILQAELASRRIRLAQQMGPPTPSSGRLSEAHYAIPGQVDGRLRRSSGTVQTGDTRYQFQQTPNGAFSLEPGNDWAGLYEDKFPFDYVPILQTYFKDLFHRVRGDVIDGMVYSDELAPGPTGWVPVDSVAGRAALRFRNAYTRPFKSGFRALKEFDQFLKNLNLLKYYPFRKHK